MKKLNAISVVLLTTLFSVYSEDIYSQGFLKKAKEYAGKVSDKINSETNSEKDKSEEKQVVSSGPVSHKDSLVQLGILGKRIYEFEQNNPGVIFKPVQFKEKVKSTSLHKDEWGEEYITESYSYRPLNTVYYTVQNPDIVTSASKKSLLPKDSRAAFIGMDMVNYKKNDTIKITMAYSGSVGAFSIIGIRKDSTIIGGDEYFIDWQDVSYAISRIEDAKKYFEDHDPRKVNTPNDALDEVLNTAGLDRPYYRYGSADEAKWIKSNGRTKEKENEYVPMKFYPFIEKNYSSFRENYNKLVDAERAKY